MTARESAEKLSPGDPVAWAALETDAFVGFPDLAWRLAPDGYDLHQGGLRSVYHFFSGVFTLIWLLCLGVGYYFPSVVAVAILAGGRFGMSHFDPSFSVPLAGAIFGYAGLVMIVDILAWRAKGAKPDAFRQSMAIVALVCCLFALAVIAGVGTQGHVSSWGVWLAVAAATTIVSILAIVVHTVVRVHAPKQTGASRGVDSDGLPTAPFGAVAKGLGRLTQQDRDGVRADLDAAITDLQKRGVITEREAASARTAELGGLGRRMKAEAARRDGSHEPGSAQGMGSAAH